MLNNRKIRSKKQGETELHLSFRLQRQKEKQNTRRAVDGSAAYNGATEKQPEKHLSFELLSAAQKHAAEKTQSSTTWNNKGVARRGIPCYAAKGT